MADTFLLQGSYSSTPLMGNPSGIPSVSAPIEEKVQLSAAAIQSYYLETDDPVVVNLPAMGVDEVGVLMVKTIGGKVVLTVTTTDGEEQTIPVESFLAWTTTSAPITALSITRAPSTVISVQLFMGQAT
jgi:hypothetical protein